MAANTQVLVVGAGPVGLFMAAELNRHGVSCRIVDKNDGPTHDSRAASIQARTLEILESIGLADEFVQGVTSAMPQPPILPTTNSSNT
jgi:2-polyprenyl-6-methoxyphenol hydroxylase-like FAD-dependent oxidoreductase